MKTIFRLASFALIATFLFSCGNKENKPQEATVADTTEVVAPEPPVAADVVEPIELKVTGDDNVCVGNDPIYLQIKGGKPFESDTKPYEVVAKENKNGSLVFKKFSKNEDGSVKVSMEMGYSGLNEDGVKMIIQVKDAAGTVKTLDYVIPFCP